MRIMLDMQGAQTESRFRGIGRYSLALARAIVLNASEHDVWIVLNANFPDTIEPIRDAFKGLLPAERIVVFSVPTLVSWESTDNIWRRRAAELIRESFLSQMQPDIIHLSSLFEGARFCDAVASVPSLGQHSVTALTLYDLIPLLKPDSYLGSDEAHQWYMDKIKNLKRADLLLTISDSVLQEAKEALSIADEHIVNISAAHTDNFRPKLLAEPDRLLLFARYGLTQPYLMYNGAVDARKNLDRLMQAFALLPSALRNRHQLLFVSKVTAIERSRIEQLALQLNIQHHLVLTGHVTDETLVSLFSHCALFVLPSIHEGFGLPALEAMACGAPTIGSNVTSIPEVIAREDALFDPFNPSDIAAKIESVLTDVNVSRSLRQHALEQSAKFSWDICAKRAIAAFEKHAPAPSQEISPTETASWAQIVSNRDSSNEQLVDAIAAIPRDASPTDADLMAVAQCIANNRIQADKVVRAQTLPDSITWRIEGPFDSSYSLALLNRETARALELLGHRVALHATDGPGDLIPNAEFLDANPDLNDLYARSQEISAEQANVTSRNLYPPRVADMTSRLNLLHHYAWEESGFPHHWVQRFNEHLQGITCLSHHVEKILIDHGVTAPMTVSGCGVDHWERIKADPSFPVSAKTFRFLHVSSCFPRKGADIMLEAYGRVFNSEDDVTLIIKTFPNPHNEIHQWLAEARAGAPNFPDVLIIEDDLGDSQLKALYAECHVLVAPSKAEGFGLPMAEAMLSGLAVITTGWGGQTDFCNDQTAWLVDYSFEPTQTHFDLFDSVWASPCVSDLARTMRDVYDTESILRDETAAKGKAQLLKHCRWSDVATRLVNAAKTVAQMPATPAPNIGWVTSWNTRCGIAAYAAHLVQSMPAGVTVLAARTDHLTQVDELDVQRCWSAGEDDELEELAGVIDERSIDTLVIQFNYGFFNLEKFAHFLQRQLDAGRVVVLTMHATIDPVSAPHKRLDRLQSQLARCHRILVHAISDLNRLKALGLVDNVTLFPHGIGHYTPPLDKSLQLLVSRKTQPTIATYGFFLPHKGLLELIESVALLHQSGNKVHLKMVNAEYPVAQSAALIQQAKQRIKTLGLTDWIQLLTAYLPDDDSLALLAQTDLIVFPYQLTAESSSAAVRSGLACGKPVAVTPLPIFDDVAAAVFSLPGHTPEKMAQGISQLLDSIANDSEKSQAKKLEAQRWCAAHRYSILGQRLHGMLQALNSAQRLVRQAHSD